MRLFPFVLALAFGAVCTLSAQTAAAPTTPPARKDFVRPVKTTRMFLFDAQHRRTTTVTPTPNTERVDNQNWLLKGAAPLRITPNHERFFLFAPASR